jgi:hypothetical protein
VGPLAAIHQDRLTPLQPGARCPPRILRGSVLQLLTAAERHDSENLCSAITSAAIRRIKRCGGFAGFVHQTARRRASFMTHLCPWTWSTVFAAQYLRPMSLGRHLFAGANLCARICAPSDNQVKGEGDDSDREPWVFPSNTIGVFTDRSLRVYG